MTEIEYLKDQRLTNYFKENTTQESLNKKHLNVRKEN